MASELKEAVKAVLEAVDALEDDRVAAACERLVGALRGEADRLDPRDAARLLGRLRKKRYFTPMQRVADALIRFGRTEPVVYRQYAQALIDRGELIPALELLTGLLERTRTDRVEHPEALGLLGRVHKQIYVEAAGSALGLGERALVEAIRCYRAGYEIDPGGHFWHGVNVVALMARAERDGGVVPDGADRAGIAERVVATVEAMEDWSAWACATAAEACVALDRWDEAEDWLQRYLQSPDADAFEVASTLRQFTEVWGFRADGSRGGDLVALLRAALLQRKDGALTLSPRQLQGMEQAQPGIFERVLGDTGMQTYCWLQTALARARAVGMVRQLGGRGIGTGFLVRGDDLRGDLGDEPLFLTNAHVISEDPADRALRPEDARVTFEARDPGTGPAEGHRVAEVVWSSGRDRLDACLVRLEPPPADLSPCPIAEHFPVLDEGDPQRLYVIGHPEGRGLEYSLQDNRLLDYERPPESLPGRCLVHYRAPTEPGSSGSPVFEQWGWRVVALHHAGGAFMSRLNGQSGTYAANEGIWIGSLQAAMA